MDFKYLQIFVTIVECGTMTAAAEVLHIAQSALSRHLQNMESTYGTQLMVRGTRRMTLTDAGKVFYAYAKKTLLMADSISKEIHDLSEGLSGTLRLGTVANLFNLWTEHVFPGFHAKYPNVKFEIHEETSTKLVDLLWDGVIDFAVIRMPVKLDGLDVYFTSEDPLAVCYRDESLFQNTGDKVQLRDLEGIPLFINRFWNARFSPLCLSAGFEPNILALNDNMSTNLLWAKNLPGCAIAPVRSIQLFNYPSFHYKIIDEPSLAFTNAIVTVKDRYLPIVAQNFLAYCLPTLEDLQPSV